jgi:hypothetical protein
MAWEDGAGLGQGMDTMDGLDEDGWGLGRGR